MTQDDEEWQGDADDVDDDDDEYVHEVQPTRRQRNTKVFGSAA